MCECRGGSIAQLVHDPAARGLKLVVFKIFDDAEKIGQSVDNIDRAFRSKTTNRTFYNMT